MTHKLPNSYPPKSFVPSSVFRIYPHNFIGPLPPPCTHFMIFPWPPVVETFTFPTPQNTPLALTLTPHWPENVVPTAPSSFRVTPAFSPPTVDINELDLAIKISQGMDVETARAAVKGKAVVVDEVEAEDVPAVEAEDVGDVEMVEVETDDDVEVVGEQFLPEQSKTEEVVDPRDDVDFGNDVLGTMMLSANPIQKLDITRPASSLPSLPILPDTASIGQVVSAVQNLQFSQNALTAYLTNAIHALDVRVADIKGETSRAGSEAHHTFNSIKESLDQIMHNQNVTIEAVKLSAELMEKKLNAYDQEMASMSIKVDGTAKFLLNDMQLRMDAMEKQLKEMQKEASKPMRLFIPEVIFRRTDNENESVEEMAAAIQDAQTFEVHPTDNVVPEKEPPTDPSTSS